MAAVIRCLSVELQTSKENLNIFTDLKFCFMDNERI